MFQQEMTRLRKAFGYSRDGLAAAYREDAPFRLEMWLTAIIVPLALVLGNTGMERAMLAGVWLLVLIVELLNCGIEALTDYATKLERHDLAKKAKDVGSAAVLIALINVALTWFFIVVF